MFTVCGHPEAREIDEAGQEAFARVSASVFKGDWRNERAR